MGYDLIPRNKNVSELTIGAFSWPIILQETGMGYVIGYGDGKSPGSYVYRTGNNGSPVSNDGYRVSSFEAKAMAAIARGYVSVQRFINREWEKLTEEERHYQKTIIIDGKPLYKKGVDESRLKQIENLAEFLENSRGFRID